MAFGSEIRASQISFLPKYGLKMEIMFQIKFGKLINPDLTDPYINGVLYMHMGSPIFFIFLTQMSLNVCLVMYQNQTVWIFQIVSSLNVYLIWI